MKPLCIDLFCGLGGWTEGFLAEGYDCIGLDIERHDYGNGGYPGQLVLQDILTVHGSQFRDATCIVASPPCQKFSYMAMPWTRAKKLAAWHRESPVRIAELNALFDTCFRIQLEASKAAGRYIPLIVENVKGAQPWVGRAKWHYGSFYLWGDVPALMPFTFSRKSAAQSPGKVWSERPRESSWSGSHGVEGLKGPGGDWFKDGRQGQDACAEGLKNTGGSWFAIGSPGQTSVGQNPDGRKVPGMNWSNHGEPGYKPKGFNMTVAQNYREGIKQEGSGAAWFDNGICKSSSRPDSRKAASAQIAKIPLPLAQYIARVFKPEAA